MITRVDANTRLYAYTEALPPLQNVHQGELIGGAAYEKVRDIVTLAGIETEFIVMPWARAYQAALTNNNAILFSLVKTPEREPLFHWIKKVYFMRLYVMSLKKRNLTLSSLNDLKAYTTVVKRHDVVDIFLRARGFKNGKELITVRDTQATLDATLRGRNDIIIASPEIIEAVCTNALCSPDDFTYHFEIKELEQHFYLATSKQLDSALLNQLKQAADSLPSFTH